MIPDEDLLAEIDRLAEGDTPPTSQEFRDAAQHSATTVVNRFGSWNTALKEAGYNPIREQGIPDEDLLAEIERLADGNSPPTRNEFRDSSEYSAKVVESRFGSWNTALKEAGYNPIQEKNIPDEDLLAEIERLADGDSPPKHSDFNNNAQYSAHIVVNRFGSWDAALSKAGYTPKNSIPAKKLLKQLRTDVPGTIAPSKPNFDGRYTPRTYERCFGSWWRATVRAGLRPSTRRPLTPIQFQQFFDAAKAQQQPKHELIALLEQFTGLPSRLLLQLTESWLMERAGEVLIRVPEGRTQSDDRWTFRVPGLWSDGNNQQETGLPGLLQWYFSQYDLLSGNIETVRHTIFQVAADANLTSREQTTHPDLGTVPLVRPSDLRTTGGIRMARHGVPRRRIRRHLGIEHTNWQASVEDFFTWCEVHDDDFSHPDWDGFD